MKTNSEICETKKQKIHKNKQAIFTIKKKKQQNASTFEQKS